MKKKFQYILNTLKGLINFTNENEEKLKNLKNENIVGIELEFNEKEDEEKKESNKLKNISCKYKIMGVVFNKNEEPQLEDILNKKYNLDHFLPSLIKNNPSIPNISSITAQITSNSQQQTDKEILKNVEDELSKEVIQIEIIGNHGKGGANYVKELNKYWFVSGGNKKIFIYDSNKNTRVSEFVSIENDNIFPVNNSKKGYIESVICSNKNQNINILKIPEGNNPNGIKIEPSKIQIKSRICFQFNEDFILCNKEKLFQVNDLFSKKDNEEIKKYDIIKGSYWTGIILDSKISKIIALTSNKSLNKGEDKLIFYNCSSKKQFKNCSVENYSFALSQNNLALMPMHEDNKTNKILICACKKYEENQKNGILSLKLDLTKNNFNILSKNFEETENFEVYSLCPISKFYNINNMYITKKENYKKIETEYFLVGGFNLDEKKGMIKLYKVIYDKVNFKNSEIKFIKNIEIKKIKNINNESNDFEGFKGYITYITQSKFDGKILLTCSDGNVYLLPITEYFYN